MENSGKLRVIAVEEHFSTPEILSAIADLDVFPGEEPERDVMALFPKNPRMLNRLTDIGTRLAEMDESGTDVAVLSANPPGPQLYRDTGRAVALAQQMNDALVGIVKAHPNRFVGLGSIAPQDPERAALEIKRIMGPLGLSGVNINSHTNGLYLDEPACEPILAALEEEDATLYLHPRVPSPQMLGPFLNYGMIGAVWGYQAEAGVHAVRLILSGALDRHPKLKIVLGHCGEALPFWLWRLDNIYSKTVGWAREKLGIPTLELKPSDYVRRNFSVTVSGMYDHEVLDFCLTKLGAERILFAVDFPYEEGGPATTFLRNAPVSEEQRALIASRNAERLFRIPPVA